MPNTKTQKTPFATTTDKTAEATMPAPNVTEPASPVQKTPAAMPAAASR